MNLLRLFAGLGARASKSGGARIERRGRQKRRAPIGHPGVYASHKSITRYLRRNG